MRSRSGRLHKGRAVLEKLSKTHDTKSTMSAEDAQGTSYFLRNRQISTKENFQTTDGPDDDCRKDIGILHRLHSWSRGIVEIVGGGGIIEYWAPIFDSEGPVQTLFIILVFLQMKLKGLGEDDYKSFFISYDNMTKRCHNLISQIIAQELRSLPCLVCHWLTHWLTYCRFFVTWLMWPCQIKIRYQKSSLPEESSCYTQNQSQKFGTNLKTKLNISQGNWILPENSETKRTKNIPQFELLN